MLLCYAVESNFVANGQSSVIFNVHCVEYNTMQAILMQHTMEQYDKKIESYFVEGVLQNNN